MAPHPALLCAKRGVRDRELVSTMALTSFVVNVGAYEMRRSPRPHDRDRLCPGPRRVRDDHMGALAANAERSHRCPRRAGTIATVRRTRLSAHSACTLAAIIAAM